MPRKTPPAVYAPQSPAERLGRLALNLWDLDQLHPEVRAKLLPILDLRREALVWVDKDRMDETAVPFAGPLRDAALAADLIRGMARGLGDPVPRVYIDRRGAGAWVRLPADVVLTHRHRGRTILDPTLFPAAGGIDYEPLPAARIRFPMAPDNGLEE